MRLVGREAELDHLRGLVEQPEVRWVTVVGLGGVGKTRLVDELVRSHVVQPGESVVFPQLSGLSGPQRLHIAMLQALGSHVSEPASEPEIDRLLGDVSWVVMESAEGLEPSEVTQLRTWLKRHTRLRLLLTSRRRLGVREEHCFMLEPLAVPDVGAREVLQSPAVELLVDCAARGAGVSLLGAATPHPAEDLAALARALGGLPLAIELCAPSVALFGAGETLQRLETIVGASSDIDSGTSRSLARVLETTWEATPPWVSGALEQLTVFRTAFSLGAVEAVVAIDGERSPMALLGALHDRALVQVAPATSDGTHRFRLHDLIHAYACERATRNRPSEADPERFDLNARHEHHFVTRIAQDPTLDGTEPWLLEEAGDILAACARVTSDPNATPARLANVGLVVRWLRIACVPMLQLEPLVARVAQPAVLEALGPRAEAQLTELVGILRGLDRSADAEQWLTRARKRAEETEDPELLFSTLMQLCHERLEQRNLADVEPAVAQMRALLDRLPDPKYAAWVKVMQSMARRDRADVPWLQAHLLEALRLFEQSTSPRRSVAWVEARLADLLVDADRGEEALVHTRAVTELMPQTHALAVYALHIEVIACGDDVEGATAALERLDEIAALNGSSVLVAEVSRAAFLLRNERWSAAVSALERLARSKEDWATTPPLALGLVVACAREGDRGRALTLFSRFLEDTREVELDASTTALRDYIGAWLDGGTRMTPPTFRPTADPVGAAVMRIVAAAVATPDQAPSPARPVLRVGPDWAWLEFPDGATLSLTRRPTLQRLVRELVTAHLEERSLSTDALFELGWPNETIEVSSARNRVRVALSRLRRAGFRELLERVHEGVRLRKELRVVHV